MSEMIGRVARAICEAEASTTRNRLDEVGVPAAEAVYAWCFKPFEERPGYEQARFIAAATAAIEEMGVPTDAMVHAGAVGSGEDSADVARGAWDAMVKAALHVD